MSLTPVEWDFKVTFDAGTAVTASEDVALGYAASGWGGDCAADGSITIEAGVDKVCDITNDDAPSLTLVKEVVNDNGGTAVAADWTLLADGYDSAAPQTGIYPLSETGPAGYSLTSLTCDNVEGQVTSVTLGLGEDVTCTFVNDDIAPQLVVIKHVINDDGGTAVASDFTMLVTGTDVSSPSFPGAEAGTTVTLDAGAYSVSEDMGIFAGRYNVSYSADCAGTVNIGETKTCTVTNDDIAGNQPSIAINSLSINLDGQVATGVFNITDASDDPEGFYILLSDYRVRWEFKKQGGKSMFEPLGAACTYDIVDIDGVAGAPVGYTTGDPVLFDDVINISYECTLDQFPSPRGTLKGTANASLFGRPDREFTFSNTFSVR